MENAFETKELEIDIKKIFSRMKSYVLVIIVATILCGLLTGIGTHFLVEPKYSATVKMYVYSNSDRITTNSTITQNEITASQELLNTYIYILESDTVLEAVAKDLNLSTTPGQLRGMISANAPKDTIAFEVTVTTTSAKWSAKIANSIAKIAPSEIVRVVKAGGVEIIDYAKTPKRPSSPNIKKNVFIGTLFGFIASFGLIFLRLLFDTSITSASDLEKEFNYPILGNIPNLDTKKKNKSYPADNTPTKPTESNDDSSDLDIKLSDTLIKNLQAMKGDEQ